MSTPVTKSELQEFGLGKLEPQRAAEVEQYLNDHPTALAEVEAVPDDDVIRCLRGSGGVPPVHAHWLLRLAVDGVIPVLAGCAGGLVGGAAGGVVGVVVGQVAEKAVNLFGLRIAGAWASWLREQPPATRIVALAELAEQSPEAVRREVLTALEQRAGQIAKASQDDREALISYLAAIPRTIRPLLLSDPATGETTLPQGLVPNDPLSLLWALPVDIPPYPTPMDLPETNYRLEELIATGGFGAVYRGYLRSEQNLPRAIKFCLDRSLIEMLRNERDNLEMLRKAGGEQWSPHLVRLYGCDLDHPTPFLVYEFVAGGDLARWMATRQIREGRGLTPGEVLGVIAQVVEGLAFAHQHGLVHRDLKPANVLMGEDGRVKLADFGIGGIVARRARQGSRIGTVDLSQLSAAEQASLFRGAGTPLYADPEQKDGAAPDPRHDLYSLGVMWFQLLVGDVTREMPQGWARELAAKFQTPQGQIALIERCVGWIDERPRNAGELIPLLNFLRLQESRQLEAWVAARPQGWDHADWLALVGELEKSEFWPVDRDSVGRYIEDLKAGKVKPALPWDRPRSRRVSRAGSENHDEAPIPKGMALPLRVGFFGLRNAGKTTASAVLYMVEHCEGLTMTVRDQASLKYLRPLAESLERGEVPHPTMDQSTLKWHVTMGGKAFDLETIDFRGEHLEVLDQQGDPIGEAALAQMRKQVREWFVHCDAILLFIDVTQEGTMRYRDALVQLLDEMSRRPTIRGSTRRAVGVVFTKGDQVARSPQDLRAAASDNAQIKDHPLYAVVQRRLREHGANLESAFFLSSALGWDFCDEPDPANRIVQPCNWFAAVRWAVDQAAVMVAQTHKQVLDEIEQEIAQEASEGAGKRLQKIDAANQKFQLSTGPQANRFLALRLKAVAKHQEEEQQGWVVFAVCCVALVVIVALAIAFGVTRSSRSEIFEGYDALAEKESTPAGMLRRLAYYDEKIAPGQFDWFCALSARREAADKRARTERKAVVPFLARDRDLYENLRKLVPTCTQNYGSLVGMEKVAKEYLRADGHTCKMAAEVNQLVERIKAVQGTTTYTWNALAIDINADSEFHPSRFQEDPTYQIDICIGNKRFSTPHKKVSSGDIKEKFATVWFLQKPLVVSDVPWGQKEVRVVVYGTLGGELKQIARWELKDEMHVMFRLRSFMSLPDDLNRNTVRVYFGRGSNNTLTELPPFRE